MLFRQAILEKIRDGDVTLAFRRWRRPTVKAGGTLNTAVGLLAIEAVDVIAPQDLTATAARCAGYDSLADLRAELDRREGTLFRIRIRYAGTDPRHALREKANLSENEVETLQERLDRLDRASRHGPWTHTVLGMIARKPRQPAGDLAAAAGFDKAWFKTQVRKLKALGLTISHQPGYELSPRGRTLWLRLRA